MKPFFFVAAFMEKKRIAHWDSSSMNHDRHFALLCLRYSEIEAIYLPHWTEVAAEFG